MSHTKGFLPVLLFLIAVGGGYFLTYKQWTALSQNRSDLSVAQEQNKTLTESKNQMNSFLTKYRQLSEEQKVADKIVPVKKSDIYNFINNLSSFSKDSAAFVTGTTFVDSKAKAATNGLTYIDMKISATGSYLSLRNFLQLMENNLRLVDVMTVMAGSGSNSDPNQPNTGDNLEFTVSARIYYQN